MADKQSQLADELKKMQWEPFLPVEKKLITWSLCYRRDFARITGLDQLYVLSGSVAGLY